MTQPGYKQFCPLAMAAELLCTRWTMVLLRELVAGTTRFNDLRRGVPKMSPTLLAQRLKELEVAGIVERRARRSEKGIFEYHLTDASDFLAFQARITQSIQCLSFRDACDIFEAEGCRSYRALGAAVARKFVSDRYAGSVCESLALPERS